MKIPPGLYRLHWKSGGSSLAAVGILYDGTRWFAPINWTNKSATGIASSNWNYIDRVERLDAQDGDRCAHGNEECAICD